MFTKITSLSSLSLILALKKISLKFTNNDFSNSWSQRQNLGSDSWERYLEINFYFKLDFPNHPRLYENIVAKHLEDRHGVFNLFSEETKELSKETIQSLRKFNSKHSRFVV